MNAIELRELNKSFRLDLRVGKRQALNALSLTVTPGEIYGVLGPNGAGKTTALRILTTLSLPDQGWARVAGHDVVKESAKVKYSAASA